MTDPEITDPHVQPSEPAGASLADPASVLYQARVLLSPRASPPRPLMALLAALGMAMAALMLAVVMVMGFRLLTI